MSHYYNLYHYSKVSSLEKIDPTCFGRDISANNLKRAAQGIPKSFYFTDATLKLPNPQERPYQYKVYLPEDWKIYDTFKDTEGLYQQAKTEQASVFLAELRFEELLKEKGYHGETYGSEEQGIVALFYPLSTKKPEGSFTACDYSKRQTAKKTRFSCATSTQLFLNILGFFPEPAEAKKEDKILSQVNCTSAF